MPDDPQTIDYFFDQGLVNSDDASALDKGELSKAVGCEYHPGSKHLYKLNGRTDTGQHLSAPIQGVGLMQYDRSTSVIVTEANGTIYESPRSTTPTFTATGVTGLSTDPEADPIFAAAQQQWLMANGIDSNYVREVGPVPIPGWTTGNWRTAGMTAPTWTGASSTTYTVATAPSTSRPASDTGDFTDGPKAYDSATGFEKTFAYVYGRSVGRAYVHTWTFGTGTPPNGIGLYIYAAMYDMHAGLLGSLHPDLYPNYVTYGLIEYTLNALAAAPTWITLYSGKGKSHAEREFHKREFYTDIVNGTLSGDMANLKVRVTLFYNFSAPNCNIQVYDIKTTDQGAGINITYGLTYGITEMYQDSSGIEHESNLSNFTLNPIAAGVANVGKITLTLPGAAAKTNPFATHINIYRTLDDNTSYPVMWMISSVPIDRTTYVDLLANISDATTFDRALEILAITYPTNEQLIIEGRDPPPIASVIATFQGCMVYVKSDDRSKLYYSRPGSVLNANFECVPSLYYLEFVTGANDDIRTVVVTNGGKSLLVFFETYTMVVYYLPQATDPGVFENRVRDYMSSTFGSAGRFTACEFFINERPPLVASVSPQGLWITDGVSMTKFWSDELNWSTIFDGVDLSLAKLTDNPVKRRLELTYLDTDGAYKEYHFFYGALEEEQNLPVKSGPHPVGIRTKSYFTVDGQWEGFSGDKSSTGAIFLEGGFKDESNGYDVNGNIPFDVTTGEFYVTGYGGSHVVGCGYPKFAATPSKTVTLVGTFSRDVGTSFVKTKTYTVSAQKKVWWHRYCDRHKLNIQDISATEMPALIGYAVEVRDAGVGRNKSGT